MNDPIVDEARRIREDHAARFHYDVDALVAEYKRLEAESGQPHVSLGPRKLTGALPAEGRGDSWRK